MEKMLKERILKSTNNLSGSPVFMHRKRPLLIILQTLQGVQEKNESGQASIHDDRGNFTRIYRDLIIYKALSFCDLMGTRTCKARAGVHYFYVQVRIFSVLRDAI